MIGSLRGEVIYKDLTKIEIDINGAGYEVSLPQKELAKVVLGEDVEVFTYHHLAEDSDELYGFLSRKSKNVFEMLLSVSGIGPKSALGIMSMGSGERIIRAIAEADVEFFKQVKGLGTKSAQRVIVDLKNKVGSVKELDLTEDAGANEDVYQALQSLGFRREEVRGALRELPEDIKEDNQKIKYVLKQLAQK